MTSPTDILSQISPETSTPVTSLGTNLGLGSPASASPVLDPTAQVAATPGMTPQVESAGDLGDWGRWGGIAAGTTYLAHRANTAVTPELADRVRDRYANEVRLQDSYPKTREAFQAARSSSGAANSSALNALRNGTAGARSVISRTSSALVDKAAARVPGGRTVVNLSRGAASAIGPRVGPRAAAVATRLGLRLALFAIPGPGWVLGAAVLAATWLFDDSMRRFVNNLTGNLFGVNNSPALDAPPEPPRTHFLPLTHDGDRDSIIETKDREMVALNDAAFAFDPSKVWHPTAPEIMTTPTFEQATLAFDELTRRAFAEREALESILRKYRGEQVVDQAAEYLKPSVASLETFGTAILPTVTELVSAHAVQTNNLYIQLRDANNASRQEIANSGAGLLPWTSSVDAGNMGQLADAYTTYATAQDQRNAALAQMFADWVPPEGASPGRLGAPGLPGLPDTPPPSQTLPGGSTPAPLPGSSLNPPQNDPGVENQGPSKEEILDRLQDLGVQTLPGTEPPPVVDPSTPFGGGMQDPFGGGVQNPFGAGMQGMQNPFGGGMQGMQNPLGQNGLGSGLNAAGAQPATAAGKPDPAKLESKLRDLLNRGQDAKDTVADKRAKDEKKTDAAAAEEPPAEEDGVTEPAGAAPTQPEPQPASPAETVSDALGVESPSKDTGADPAMSKTAEVAGKVIEFEDPRSARMAEIMQAEDGTPPTVQQAATEAGYTLPPAGEPIGERYPPADLRPGDLIMGDNNRNGLYLGDGKVLTGGEVRPIADVANFVDDLHGIFRLEDADPVAASAGNPPGDTGALPPDAPTGHAPADDSATPAPEPAAEAGSPAGEEDTAPALVGDTQAVGDSATAAPPTQSLTPSSTGMPLPRASTPTSDTADGTPAAPTVPVGD